MFCVTLGIVMNKKVTLLLHKAQFSQMYAFSCLKVCIDNY